MVTSDGEHPTDGLEGDIPRSRVRDVPRAGRYELVVDDMIVGQADYRVEGARLVVPHVEVDHAHRGRGFASDLMAGLVDDARARGLAVVPLCPYAAAWFRRHPEASDALA